MRTACLCLILALVPQPAVARQADLIITAERVWTGDPDRPWAEAVAIRGDRILAVGSRADIMAVRGTATRVIDMPDRFISPGFIDNHTHFYEPYLTTGVRGSWRTMMTEPPGMLRLLLGADSAGHWPQVHAIGDEAIDSLLDMYEYVINTNSPKERRFRIIHTQVLRGPEVAERMARLGIIAEVQPYHAIDGHALDGRAHW